MTVTRGLTKRRSNALFIKALLAGALVSAAPAAAEPVTAHGLSLFGSVKYEKGFERFDYVNPEAPKGGKLRYGAIGSFDTLNPYIVKGRPAAGIQLIYDTLMTLSLDEPSSEYGLIAESVTYPEDFSSVTFTLNARATFQDGTRIKPEDVVWTFETLKANHPFYNAYYADVVKAEKLSPLEVKFTFAVSGNRELPQIVSQLPVLPKHYWAEREFNATTLEPPLGSGPYRVKEVKAGQSITYERVEDYWAQDLNVNVGANNFGEMEFIYFGDPTIALEAFKAGNVDVRLENSAKNWATGYDVPAVKDGRIVRDELETGQGEGMQAFVFNLRREKFQDPRVREALNYAFDFEWMNKNIFYGQYTRTDSYFENSELAATGLPEGREKELLEEHRESLPEELFTEPYENPVTDGSGNNRDNLRKAVMLLEEAGWSVKDNQLVNKETGKPLEIEFLLVSPTFERVVQPFARSLERLGIESSIRLVDTAQYQNRTDNYNFDVVVGSFPQSLSPGNEQRDFWGCEAGKAPGGRNLMGICNPVIEALIDKVIFAKDRAELVAATKALDRVLLWNHYVIPQWHSPVTRVARWAHIKHPEPTPEYAIGFPNIWWDARAASE